MSKQFCLRFLTRQQADTELAAVISDYLDGEGNVVMQNGRYMHGRGGKWHLTHIGPLGEEIEINELGVEVVVQAADLRHHVNLLVTDEAILDALRDSSLVPFMCFPATPRTGGYSNSGAEDADAEF